MRFYDFQNRKAQHKRVTTEELREIFTALQAILNSAMRDVTLLEDAYKELKASLDPEYAKEYERQKAELAEKQAEYEAKAAARDAKKNAKKEKKASGKAAADAKSKAFEQCTDEDYEDIEDID